MADEIESTFDKLKAGAKAVAKKVINKQTNLGVKILCHQKK
jgi:hypothetical protein